MPRRTNSSLKKIKNLNKCILPHGTINLSESKNHIPIRPVPTIVKGNSRSILLNNNVILTEPRRKHGNNGYQASSHDV